MNKITTILTLLFMAIPFFSQNAQATDVCSSVPLDMNPASDPSIICGQRDCPQRKAQWNGNWTCDNISTSICSSGCICSCTDFCPPNTSYNIRTDECCGPGDPAVCTPASGMSHGKPQLHPQGPHAGPQPLQKHK